MRALALYLGVLLLFFSGCTSIEYVNQPAPEIMQADEVCIIEHDDTREMFKTTLKEWLYNEGIPYQVFRQDAAEDVCTWTLTYFGRWSWVGALYLADAEIVAYQEGSEAGRVALDVGKWDGSKWENSKERIFRLMDMLSGKVDDYEPKVFKKPKEDKF